MLRTILSGLRAAETEKMPDGIRSPLRRWWRRERPAGVVLFLFAVRWGAWGVAAIIVFLGILPEANVRR